MRPMRLDMAGFTVFREETTVDFTDADYFALVGPTGSGKSTVLDAICFALYGTVPRWGGARGLANALAPSANEARVRLVFESAGDRYVATRVVRRDGRGTVKTANAGLQLMPPGFDVTKLDTGLSPEDLGEVVAGTPAEMEQAVLDAVGLPYEQFTSCVVLPQGQFADFLHAKPATRQQILVNLLGLGIYEEVQKKATERAGQAEARLETVDKLLGGLGDIDDEALAAARQRVGRMRELAEAVAVAVPELDQARATAREAAVALAALDAELAVLAGVRPPDGIAELARAVAAARVAADEAAAAVGLAEEREEKLRGELAAAGDESSLRLLLKAYADREKLTGQVTAVEAAVAAARTEHEAAAGALAEARAAAERAEAELAAAFRAHEEAKAADQAVALRAHLVEGGRCPVCEQAVSRVPAVPEESAVARAIAAGKAARAASEAARRVVQERDAAARELDRVLLRARAEHDQLRTRLAELDDQLAGAAAPGALREALDEHARLRRALAEAAGAVRAGRDAARRARGELDGAQERLRRAWQDFDATRDGLARFGPPAADREDVAAAWTALAGWAGEQAERRRADRERLAASVGAAEAAVGEVAERIGGRPGAALHYTLDGSEPTDQSPMYAGPIVVTQTTNLKARALHASLDDGYVAAATFTRLGMTEPIVPSKTSPGLACTYYEGSWDKLPGFDTLKSAKSVVLDSITVPSFASDEDYGVVISGYITVPRDGLYDFFIGSDDGSDFRIADTLLIDNDGLHGMGDVEGGIGLKAGTHQIQIRMFQKKGDEGLHLLVDGPGVRKQSVPPSWLSHAPEMKRAKR